MTLRQKISWQIGAMLLGLLFVSGASLWGINGLNQDYGVALAGYQQLRQVYVAGTHLSTAQKLLQWPHPQSLSAARMEVQAAVTEFARLKEAARDDGMSSAIVEMHFDMATIASNLALLESAPEGRPPVEAIELQRDAIVAQLGKIAQLSSGIRRATESAQSAAQNKRHATIALLATLCGIVVLSAVVLGIIHYRGVMNPIRRLTVGVRRLTAGQFQGRIEARGKDELASLARDFNRMAEELDGFYHQLERKVAEKSRELIRSERLASVGYLAAGVAHEINNPLGIMLGYAEYSIAELQKLNEKGIQADPAVAEEVARSLRIICDEAFRCKAITQKLLSLARGGDEGRKPISLLAVANEVASIVGGLKEHRDKRLVVRSESLDQSDESPTVNAVEPEMKQVLLNLTINALEAVPAVSGEVKIDVRRLDGWVELAVADNGRGMSPTTLDRVFEPFFTEKRGTREDGGHGTGLGLSITHAIIQSHGGTITAESEGPGRGSRFVVRLPWAGKQAGV